MKLITEEQINGWSSIQNQFKFPSSIDYNCPHCGRLQTTQLTWRSYNKSVNYLQIRCAGCKEVSILVYVDLKPMENELLKGSLYLYPDSNNSQERCPKEDILALGLDWERIKKAYLSAITVFNAGAWPATLGECRRTLEGISKKLVTDESITKLHKRLEQLPEKHDLQKPILDLAFLVKEGGNLGAHFDNEKDPDAELASMMLDLLEYIIEYLFVLPGRIENIKSKVQ